MKITRDTSNSPAVLKPSIANTTDNVVLRDRPGAKAFPGASRNAVVREAMPSAAPREGMDRWVN